MIEAIRSWLLGVTAAAVCLTAFYAILPKGAVRSIARASGGLVLLIVMLQPLLGWDGISLRQEYGDYRQELDRQITRYRAGYQQELEQRIREETAAYISDKAEQLGLDCRVEVIVRQEGEVPVPAEVELDIPPHAGLSHWIAAELGIEETQQHWKESP